VRNWRQSPKARKAKKLSDDAATNGDPPAFVLRNDVSWQNNVENDKQRKNVVGNWRQSPEARQAEKFE